MFSRSLNLRRTINGFPIVLPPVERGEERWAESHPQLEAKSTAAYQYFGTVKLFLITAVRFSAFGPFAISTRSFLASPSCFWFVDE